MLQICSFTSLASVAKITSKGGSSGYGGERMSTGEKLTSLMEETGIGIMDLSRMTGLSDATISRMRNGDRNGTLDSWLLVSDCLGIPLSVIVEEVEVEYDY